MTSEVVFQVEPIGTGHYRLHFQDIHGRRLRPSWFISRRELETLLWALERDGEGQFVGELRQALDGRCSWSCWPGGAGRGR